jgi:hypothetical protein
MHTPYFTSGRLLGGGLIPFALLYVYGVAYLLRRITAVLPVFVLGLIVAFVTISEISSGSRSRASTIGFTSDDEPFDLS